jgi:heterotetrameric sarcosine oxidase gamma subunit
MARGFMLERASALAGVQPLDAPQLRMREDGDFSLVQVAQPAKDVTIILGKLPTQTGTAIDHDGRTLMQIGPSQFWVVGSRSEEMSARLMGKGIVTPLSSGRTRILLEGPLARDVLARSAPMDFSLKAFAARQFVMTGIHHTPVLIHCTAEQAFHIYALRTFAQSVWEWLEDSAEGLHAQHP